jgi:hypothetical protein
MDRPQLRRRALVTATTTDYIMPGWYCTYDENGYLLATIRRHTEELPMTRPTTASRPWAVIYTGGANGGNFRTLKAAKAMIEKRWTEDE